MTDEEKSSKLTAKQKMIMYLTTVGIVAFVYLAPAIFNFITGLPEAAWKALAIPLVVLALAPAVVGAYAIWSVFSTAKMGIRKDADKDRMDSMARMEKKPGDAEEGN